MEGCSDDDIKACVEKLHANGLASLPDFLSVEEVQELKDECTKMIVDLSVDEKPTTFSTTNEQARDEYFLNSGDKIRYFYEEDAFDERGNLVVNKFRSLNKIGHALHWLNPVFKQVSFSEKIQKLVKQIGFKDPVIVQSMYIFKNPGIGGEVTPHQDATFLHTEPNKLIGLWFPLEDATLENGCLWYIPGSHKTKKITRRFVRNTDPDGPLTKFVELESTDYTGETFVPVPVGAGSCVVIHGNVVHKSEKNTSPFPRPAYTFHIIDRDESVYSPQNWLQPTEELPFPSLYGNS